MYGGLIVGSSSGVWGADSWVFIWVYGGLIVGSSSGCMGADSWVFIWVYGGLIVGSSSGVWGADSWVFIWVYGGLGATQHIYIYWQFFNQDVGAGATRLLIFSSIKTAYETTPIIV